MAGGVGVDCGVGTAGTRRRLGVAEVVKDTVDVVAGRFLVLFGLTSADDEEHRDDDGREGSD